MPATAKEIDGLHGEAVTMRGYRTTQAKGVFNSLITATLATRIVRGKEERFSTLEWCCTSLQLQPPFSQVGDSGSMVYIPVTEDKDDDKSLQKRVIGMVWGGYEQNNTSYLVRIDHLFEDIKRFTDASGIRFYDR